MSKQLSRSVSSLLCTHRKSTSELIFPRAVGMFGEALMGRVGLRWQNNQHGSLTRQEPCHYFHVQGWVNYKIWFLICSLSEEVQSLEPVIRHKSFDYGKCRALEVGGLGWVRPVCGKERKILSFEEQTISSQGLYSVFTAWWGAKTRMDKTCYYLKHVTQLDWAVLGSFNH